MDECCEETPLEGVFEVELGSEVRSVSIMGGLGDLDGLRDIALGDREEGNEDRDVLRAPAPALPLESPRASVVLLVGMGRCMAAGEMGGFLVFLRLL